MYARKSLPSVMLVIVVAGLALLAGGCAAAAPDASKAISRDVIQSGGIVPAEELRVAEYLNYYEQKFPESANSTLGLDLRLGNPTLPAGAGEAWLQIGVQARSARAEEIAPLNLAIVIDRSGSMDSPEKMPYLKQSLRVFLNSLAAQDIVAIVAYNDSAEVIWPAQAAGDKRWIEAAIGRIQPGGSTNLYGGLMLGFQEVDRNFDIRRNNRVVLLTDGIANVGTTDPAIIARDALAYNQKGIYLSTIGLGHDFNDRLLSTLATQGKGGYHFIDSAEEMDKVFRKEVSGLVQKAAEAVSVLLEPGPGVRVLSITGYEGLPPVGPVQINLKDMGTGDSQIVLVHLDITAASSGETTAQRRLAQVELRYTDLFSERPESQRLPVLAAVGAGAYDDPLQDLEVLRNVTVQRTAEALKEISRLYGIRRYQEAWNLAYQSEQELRNVARLTGEAQMYKDADLMRQYQGTLAQWVQRDTGRAPLLPEATSDRSPVQPDDGQAGRLYRGATPTPDAPVIEIQ